MITDWLVVRGQPAGARRAVRAGEYGRRGGQRRRVRVLRLHHGPRFFDRHLIDVLIGAIMALCFAYQFAVLVPQAGIGWQAHIGSLVGGVLAGWLFRDKRPRPSGKPSPVTTATRSVAGGTLPTSLAGMPKSQGAPGS